METITFGRWVRYLTREWRHDGDMDDLIGFAIRMATFAPDGGEVYPLVGTLAELAGITEGCARRRRRNCIRLGMFARTGEQRRLANGGKTDVLKLALPPHTAERTLHAGVGRSLHAGIGRIERRKESERNGVGAHVGADREAMLRKQQEALRGFRPGQ